ncbi:unnamed protein product [Mucor fragilis]
MFSNLVNRFSPLATLYNHLVVVKSVAACRYYYDAHQTKQNQKTFQYNACAGANQDVVIITDNIANEEPVSTEESISGDKITQDHADDDFCIVGADSGDNSSTTAAAVATIPSVDNALPAYSSSAPYLVNYAYRAASVVVENATRTAICGAVRSCNFVWSEKRHIKEIVQEKTKKYTQPKMRGFGVDFANVPSIKFNLAGSPSSAATVAA